MNDIDKNLKTSSVNKLPILLVVLIVAAAGTLMYRYMPWQFKSNTLTTSNTNTIPTHEYTSKKLGIRFTYVDEDLRKKILIQEVDDKVFVYTEGMQPEDGQYVEVITKDPNMSLQQAVEKKFLQGIDKSVCFVQAGTDLNSTPPASGVAMIIAYPITENVNDTWLKNQEKCPPTYSLTNGLTFFWTDKDNSDRYMFFSIGQYLIPATATGTSWHTTLEIIH